MILLHCTGVVENKFLTCHLFNVSANPLHLHPLIQNAIRSLKILMENAEEQDVKLERSATQYIIEIETSLTFLLWERADPQDVSSVRFSVRRLVQARRVSQLIKLVCSPFVFTL